MDTEQQAADQLRSPVTMIRKQRRMVVMHFSFFLFNYVGKLEMDTEQQAAEQLRSPVTMIKKQRPMVHYRARTGLEG
ncbi:hypothetical protein ACET3Z_028503 [Daucus carota]